MVKLQDDDVVLKMDDEAINNIRDFKKRIEGEKVYKTMTVWRFQKEVVLDLPDPADCTIPVLLEKKDWRVISFDSESKGYAAKLAIDGDPTSFWHTQFEPTEPPFPHELVVDMREPSILTSMEYMARQDSSHPRIKDFELYVSTSRRGEWGEPVLKGTLKDTDALQSLAIAEAKEARFFKFVGLSGYTRKAGAVAEISFYGTCVPKK